MVVLIVSTWSHELSTASAKNRCYIFGLNHLRKEVAEKTFDEVEEKLGDLQLFKFSLGRTELNMCEVDVLNGVQIQHCLSEPRWWHDCLDTGKEWIEIQLSSSGPGPGQVRVR